MAATLSAKEEGKKVAYAYIQDAHDEILLAMDIVPAWGESFSGICAAKRDAEKYLQKAESDNFSRSLCTYATCNLGFDMLREELGEAPPGAPWGGMGRPDMIIGSAQQLCDPRFKWPQATQHYMPDVPVFVGGMYYPPLDPNSGSPRTGEILCQVRHRGTPRVCPFLREAHGQEDGLGQAGGHR